VVKRPAQANNSAEQALANIRDVKTQCFL